MLVKYGAGIIQASGSIAGNVHARNRFGNYVRPRTKPVNPRSGRQESARAIVSYLAEYWHNDLEPAERGLWDTYAAAVAMKNRLGETIHLTGFNHFIRSNGVLLKRGGLVEDAAPEILSLPEKDYTSYAHNTSIASQTVQMHCSTDGWTPDGDTKAFQHWYMGQPQLASRNFFAGPWRWMGATNATQGASGTSVEFPAPFNFAEGQKVWFQSRIETLSARISNLWTLPPLTIPGDA